MRTAYTLEWWSIGLKLALKLSNRIYVSDSMDLSCDTEKMLMEMKIERMCRNGFGVKIEHMGDIRLSCKKGVYVQKYGTKYSCIWWMRYKTGIYALVHIT